MSALPIKIYIRTRPTTDFAGDNIKILDDKQTITVNIDKSDPLNFLNKPTCNYTFKFHSILHNVSQEIVFEEAAREIVDSFIQGYNGCIFSFGQKGSGKTFTMFGGIRHAKYRGVIPRAIAYIYSELEKFKTIQFTLTLQYCSIYNDIIYDLLSNDEKEMQMQEDTEGNPYIQNLSSHQVTDVHTAISMLLDGDSKLSLGEHKYHRAVNKSHTVFILDLVGRKGTRMTHSRLLMLDLAAAEEAGDSAYVNQSMSYLQQLVVSITDKDIKHLPFRRSKLTYLLKDAIGGNCRTSVIANVWPEKQNNKETLSTFKFASELGKVMNDAHVNTMEPLELQIERLQEEKAMLEAEAELQDELAGNVKVDGLKEDDEKQVADLVSLFLSDEIDTIPLQSAAHIKAIFAEIKRRYIDIPNEIMREVGQNFTLTERVKNVKAPKDVGTVDGAGFSIGVAPSQDRPCNIRTVTKLGTSSQQQGGRAENPAVPTKEQMFEIFKLRDGKAQATDLIEAKRETKSCVEAKKQAVEHINSIHDELQNVGAEIDRRGIRGKSRLFEEDAFYIQKEIDLKKQYRESYADIQQKQANIDALKEKCATLRTTLLNAFEEWYNKWLTNELYTEPVVPPNKDAEALANGKESAASKSKKNIPTKANKKPPIKGKR